MAGFYWNVFGCTQLKNLKLKSLKQQEKFLILRNEKPHDWMAPKSVTSRRTQLVPLFCFTILTADLLAGLLVISLWL